MLERLFIALLVLIKVKMNSWTEGVRRNGETVDKDWGGVGGGRERVRYRGSC